MARLFLFASLVALLGVAPRAESQPAGDAAKLSSISWLVGSWKSGPGERVACEEHWSEPAGGAMMGMFRILQGDKPSLYEFLLIEETADGVMLRLRHYRPGMVDMDKAPIRLKLVEASDKKVVFEDPDNDQPKRITYTLDGQQLTAVVETTRNGKPVHFTLRMERVKPK